MLSLGKNENKIFPHNISMNNVPKFIKIGTNLTISKSSKNKIRKEYGIKFRGKSKKQQKTIIMREAKALRATEANFRNEKYAWRFLAKSYNVALVPQRRAAIERKRKELKRFILNITMKWTGYNIKGMPPTLKAVKSGEKEASTDSIREKDIELWKKEMMEELKAAKQRVSPFDDLKVEIINETKLPIAKSIPLTYRKMRMAGVLDLGNMVENDIWCKNNGKCVPNLLQYRYGKRKGFKKITSDEKIEFWATHIEDDTELLGYILDTELEIAGKGWENPNEEGYCIKHVVNWCKKARVNMYALVDNEVIETYWCKEAGIRRNPPLVFEMKNSHLYPVLDTTKIKKITNNRKRGDIGIKSNNQQEAKNDPAEKTGDEEEEDTELIIKFRDMDLWNKLEEPTKVNYALEIMGRDNKISYPNKNLCLYQGELHNFKIGNTKYLLQKPPLTELTWANGKGNYSKTALLNDDNLKTIMTYCCKNNIQYTGQRPQQFTNDLFKEFTKTHSSYFSQDVDEALNKQVKNRVHWGKVEKFDWSYEEERNREKDLWQTALSYDLNKCYRSVMEFPIEPFMTIGFNDTIQDYKEDFDKNGDYKLGIYYVKTNDNSLFHYDNKYSSSILNEAKKWDIDFEPHYFIKGTPKNFNPLKTMIDGIIMGFSEYPKMMKLIINSIWGYLMKTNTSCTFLNVDEDIQRVYDTHIKEDGCHNKNTSLMFNKREILRDEGEDGKTLYTYGSKKNTLIKATNLPMAIQVCDQANIKLFQLQKEMETENSVVLYRNTDNVIVGYPNKYEYNEVKKKMKPTNEPGGYSEKEVPSDGYKIYYPEKTYEQRRYHFRHHMKVWEDLPYNDSDDWLDIISEMVEKGGGQLLGRAGTGKSYVCIEGMKTLEKIGIRCKALAFTNKATIQLKGSTIHKFMAIDKDGKLNVQWARKQSSNIDVILIDEISMISQDLWKMLAEFKSYTGIKFILIGDYRQLPPVDDRMGTWEDYFNHPTIMYLCNNVRCELNQMKRYDIKLWDLLEDVWENKVWTDKTQEFVENTKKATIDDMINNKNVCYLNKTRKKINEMVQNKIKPDDAILVPYIGEANKYNQDIYLFQGAKLIMYHTTKDKMFKKNEEVEVVGWDEKGVVITNGTDQAPIVYVNSRGKNIMHKLFLLGYATTIHKSQGDTIDGDVNIFNMAFLRSSYIGDLSSKKAIYTALSRARSLENIKICRL